MRFVVIFKDFTKTKSGVCYTHGETGPFPTGDLCGIDGNKGSFHVRLSSKEGTNINFIVPVLQEDWEGGCAMQTWKQGLVQFAIAVL